MKYHALFVIFKKSGNILNCRLLQIIGGAFRVNVTLKSFVWCIKTTGKIKGTNIMYLIEDETKE